LRIIIHIEAGAGEIGGFDKQGQLI
jgi:hypothetical protein